MILEHNTWDKYFGFYVINSAFKMIGGKFI